LSEMDAYEDMGRFFRHSDRDLDRLLDGKALANEGELEELAAFLSEARAALTQPGDRGTEARHLASMAEASSSLIEKGDPVARPVSKVIGPAQQVSGLPKQRGVPVMARLLSTMTGKISALVMGLLMSTTGLAFANVLPASLQNAFSSAGNAIGLSIPDADDEGDEAEVEDLETDDLEVEDHADDDQGEDADDQGDDDQGDASDDQGEDADDQGDNDQGEDADDQGDNDQGDDDQDDNEADDDQGEDAGDQGDDDQGDDASDQADDDQDDDSVDEIDEIDEDQAEDN
jgi:hypothetical protein